MFGECGDSWRLAPRVCVGISRAVSQHVLCVAAIQVCAEFAQILSDSFGELCEFSTETSTRTGALIRVSSRTQHRQNYLIFKAHSPACEPTQSSSGIGRNPSRSAAPAPGAGRAPTRCGIATNSLRTTCCEPSAVPAGVAESAERSALPRGAFDIPRRRNREQWPETTLQRPIVRYEGDGQNAES